MDGDPKERDKRQSERIRIFESRQIWNLSEGGAYIATDNPRRLGATLHFRFRLESDMPVFEALAKVVRVLHKKNPKTGEPKGMAVQFVKVEEDNLSNLREFLKNKKMQEKVMEFHQDVSRVGPEESD